MAPHDPTRDVERFDAYRAALRDAVGADAPTGQRARTRTPQSLRRRKPTKTPKG